MKRTALTLALASLSLLFSGLGSRAAETGTAQEAKAMLERAVSEMKSNEAAALAKFNKGEAGFKDRDLYVFCVDIAQRKLVAHVRPDMVGRPASEIKDPTGKVIGDEVINAAKEGQYNQVSYMFPRPGGTEPVAKESYVTKVGGLACGVGYYK